MSWEYLLWGAVLFVATFFGSLLCVGVLLVKLPSTYFAAEHPQRLRDYRHPAVRLVLRVLKNLLGLCLVVAGVLLSVPGIPGQGVLTMLIGIMLLDFPGKRRLERKLVSRKRVLNTINRLRQRFGKPPLVVSEPSPVRNGGASENQPQDSGAEQASARDRQSRSASE